MCLSFWGGKGGCTLQTLPFKRAEEERKAQMGRRQDVQMPPGGQTAETEAGAATTDEDMEMRLWPETDVHSVLRRSSRKRHLSFMASHFLYGVCGLDEEPVSLCFLS